MRGEKPVPDANRRTASRSRPENQTPYVTAAVGIEETAGRLRARRVSLFTQTVIWVTSLICLAFLLGALFQAWSNSQLMLILQQEQHKTQQLQNEHDRLAQQAAYYQDPYVIESEARRLGYARPGEHVLVITGSKKQNQPPAPVHPAAAHGPGFWQAWWDFFFGHG